MNEEFRQYALKENKKELIALQKKLETMQARMINIYQYDQMSSSQKVLEHNRIAQVEKEIKVVRGEKVWIG